MDTIQPKKDGTYVTCRCGALVRYPDTWSVDADDRQDAICSNCDKPLGQKLYEAFAR